MRIHEHSGAKRPRESGQILPLFALWIVVLIPFVGLSIDLGFAYITKAELSKAVDAAALAGISNFNQGQAVAQEIATSTFDANFAPTGSLPGRYVGMPVPVITFLTDAYGNQSIQVQATATINTFFIRMLPAIGGANWNTLAVGDTGQATRARVIMTLVLDHSFSMDPACSGSCACTGGGAYLPTAVANFVSVFEDNVDQAAMVSFGATAVTNVAMETPFKADITTAANNLLWTGGTFSQGGLSNALAINNGVVVPANVNAIKAVIFFTDGQCNMIQDSFACTGTTVQAWNYGGWQAGDGEVGFWYPNDSNTCAQEECPNYANPAGTAFGPVDMTCGTVSCGPLSGFCPGVTNFPSITGAIEPITSANIVTESEARCIAVANQMRANGMYVYSIGLAVNAGCADVPTIQFLQQVANDPELQTTDPGAFEPNLPQGQAVISGNGADLTQLFQQIASDIILRLTY